MAGSGIAPAVVEAPAHEHSHRLDERHSHAAYAPPSACEEQEWLAQILFLEARTWESWPSAYHCGILVLVRLSMDIRGARSVDTSWAGWRSMLRC